MFLSTLYLCYHFPYSWYANERIQKYCISLKMKNTSVQKESFLLDVWTSLLSLNSPQALGIKYVTVCFLWKGKVMAEVRKSMVLPSGLSEGRIATLLAWMAYQEETVVKYMSFKECN